MTANLIQPQNESVKDFLKDPVTFAKEFNIYTKKEAQQSKEEVQGELF